MLETTCEKSGLAEVSPDEEEAFRVIEERQKKEATNRAKARGDHMQKAPLVRKRARTPEK